MPYDGVIWILAAIVGTVRCYAACGRTIISSALRAQKKRSRGMETSAHLVQVLQRDGGQRLTQYLQTAAPRRLARPQRLRPVGGARCGRPLDLGGRAVLRDRLSCPAWGWCSPAGALPVGTSTRVGRNAFGAREAIALRAGAWGTSCSRPSVRRWTSSSAALTRLSPQEWTAQPTVPCASCRCGTIPS